MGWIGARVLGAAVDVGEAHIVVGVSAREATEGDWPPSPASSRPDEPDRASSHSRANAHERAEHREGRRHSQLFAKKSSIPVPMSQWSLEL